MARRVAAPLYTVLEAVEIMRAVGTDGKLAAKLNIMWREFDEKMSEALDAYKRSVLEAIRKKGGTIVEATFTIPAKEVSR